MDSLMSRLLSIVKAKISALLGQAEDPSETLEYSYERQLALLHDVKRGIADVVTSKKRLQLRAGQVQASLDKLDGQAREALAADREDLARRALERKAFAEQQVQGLGRQVEQLEAQQEKLTESERRLSAKIEAFRSEKEVIKARYSAAEAQVRISEAATGIGEQMAETGLAIQRARDRTEQMEARASALDELVEAGTLEDLTAPGTDLDRELAALTSGKRVEEDLERLRAEVGAGAGGRELGR